MRAGHLPARPPLVGAGVRRWRRREPRRGRGRREEQRRRRRQLRRRPAVEDDHVGSRPRRRRRSSSTGPRRSRARRDRARRPRAAIRLRSPTTATAIGRERATHANAVVVGLERVVRRLDAHLQRGIAALRHRASPGAAPRTAPSRSSRSSASTPPRVTRSRTFCAARGVVADFEIGVAGGAGRERRPHFERRDADVGGRFEDRVHGHRGVERPRGGAVSDEVDRARAGEPRPRRRIAAAGPDAVERGFDQREIGRRPFDQAVCGGRERQLRTRRRRRTAGALRRSPRSQRVSPRAGPRLPSTTTNRARSAAGRLACRRRRRRGRDGPPPAPAPAQSAP